MHNLRYVTYGIPLIALLGLILLLQYGLKISTEALVTIVVALIGIPFAVDNVFLQINKTLQRQLETQAVKDLNLALKNVAEAFVSIVTYDNSFVVEPLKIPIHHWYDAASKKHLEIVTETINLRLALGSFYIALEENEIAIIHLEHYYRYLTILLGQLIEHVDALSTEFMHATCNPRLTKEQYELEVACFTALKAEWADITAYMMDFRKMLQNDLLGDVFKRHLKPRKPFPGYGTTLDKVATKERVQELVAEYEREWQSPQPKNDLNRSDT